MEAITLPVYNIEGKEVETIKLDTAVFDGKVNSAAIYQAVNAYRANQRKGLAATKTRGEVSGGGRKPWKQKGTGRARVGSTRSPLWRHGGVVFGPHPRDFSYQLPQKIRNVALKSSLNAKVKENNFLIVDNLEVNAPKTKEASRIINSLSRCFVISKQQVNEKMVRLANHSSNNPEPSRGTSKRNNKSLLILTDNLGNNLKLAFRNINSLTFNLSRDTHAYEVLASKKLIITKSALTQLTKRLK